MKTMTLCAIAFGMLLLLIGRGFLNGDPVTAYVIIFAAACGWALLMWFESGADELLAKPKDEAMKRDGEV